MENFDRQAAVKVSIRDLKNLDSTLSSKTGDPSDESECGSRKGSEERVSDISTRVSDVSDSQLNDGGFRLVKRGHDSFELDHTNSQKRVHVEGEHRQDLLSDPLSLTGGVPQSESEPLDTSGCGSEKSLPGSSGSGKSGVDTSSRTCDVPELIVPEMNADWGGSEAKQLFDFLKSVLLPNYDCYHGSFGLETHLDRLMILLRSHLRMLKAQKASQEAQNGLVKTEIMCLEMHERRLISTAAMKGSPLHPQILISQVEKEVLAELKINHVEELSREEKWSQMLENNKELLASFRENLLPKSRVPIVAMETYETLNRWTYEQLRRLFEICIPLLLTVEQQEFLRALCRFKHLRYRMHDIELFSFMI